MFEYGTYKLRMTSNVIISILDPVVPGLDQALHAENLAAAFQGTGRVAEAEARGAERRD